MKSLSSFNRPHVVPNPHDFLSLMKDKMRFRQNVCSFPYESDQGKQATKKNKIKS